MKNVTKTIAFTACLLTTGLITCSGEADDPPVIATVGNEKITSDDFKRAYIPVLLYSDKKESPETREEILNFLIDQSILAQTARAMNLDTIPTIDVLRRTAEKTAFTRILYKDQVRSQVRQISDETLREAYKRSHTKRLVRHLFSEDEAEIRKISNELQQGSSWDSLAQIHFRDPSLAESGGTLGWMTFGDMDPGFEDAVFELSEGVVSNPIQTRFGWHIIQVLDESKELLLTEYDYQIERSSLEQTIRSRREQSLADSVINRLMGEVDLRFDPVIAPKVWDIVHTQIHLLLDESSLDDISPREIQSFANVLEPLLKEEMLTFSGTTWLVKDFVDRLPEMNRQLMLSDLKKATGFLVRDEVIFNQGLRQGLNQREDVKAEIRDRENQFLANLYLRYKASQHQLSEESLRTYYQQNANARYLAPDSLYIQEVRLKDPKRLTDFTIAVKSNLSLEDLKKQYPLSVRSLGWVQGATPEVADYYHRLINVPVRTLLGPIPTSKGDIFIRAEARRRTVKSMDQVRDQLEQDAFDHWLQRLKLEELADLRDNFSIHIDRDLLLNFHI